ncbi:MAG: Na-translocating system protein MpsB, partial [Chromatiaceae bacterium]
RDISDRKTVERELIESQPLEVYLRSELHGSRALPEMAHVLEDVLFRRNKGRIARAFAVYHPRKRRFEAQRQAARLMGLAGTLNLTDQVRQLPPEQLRMLLQASSAFLKREGMIWLEAMEAKAMGDLLQGLNLEPPAARDKRPFAKALFCIDTRSERIRRNLESVGDYQTYGIAGFFGVPVSFMELGKGSETHLCPVLLTPKNLVVEMTATGAQDEAALGALEKAMHELKESVLTPFVTVEAIGLLFGFDMVGKTLLPTAYNRWRRRLHESERSTHLVVDKLGREQADSIVRAVQRAVIVKAVEQELGLASEQITDGMVRELRECALGNRAGCPVLAAALGLDDMGDDTGVERFIDRLRDAYRINQSFAQVQLERVGRIGFSLDEQTRFVTQAQMANKPEVRHRLRASGIHIPDDAWFVPALHDTTTDEIRLHDLALLPPSHLMYLDRLRNGLSAASRLCAQERLPTLEPGARGLDPAAAARRAHRNAMDWSQVRPEWGLSRNAYFVIAGRSLTRSKALDGRAFLHSYDYRVDPKRRLLENILTGPLVVGQWINMEHYFSTVDNERFGSGSKVYHNVAGRFGVMTGNLSDLRTGLPAQTVLDGGQPYHQPMRLITLIEAPLDHARQAVEEVAAVNRLVRNGWIRLLVIDPEGSALCLYDKGEWRRQTYSGGPDVPTFLELCGA